MRIASENPRYGYTRIRDAVNCLGHEVGRNTVKRILAGHGIEPAPERGSRTPWKTFLAAHWEAVAGADFFTVEVLTWRGLVRYSVFFVLELTDASRRDRGITCQTERGVDEAGRSQPDRCRRWLSPGQLGT